MDFFLGIRTGEQQEGTGRSGQVEQVEQEVEELLGPGETVPESHEVLQEVAELLEPEEMMPESHEVLPGEAREKGPEAGEEIFGGGETSSREDLMVIEESEDNILTDDEDEADEDEADEEEDDGKAANKRKHEESQDEAERSRRMTDEEINCIAQKLADILEEKQEEKKARSERDSKIEENWLMGDVMLVCRPCSMYSKSPEVPQQCRAGIRGTCGIIQRKGKDGKKRPAGILKKVCARHEKRNIHIWCALKEKKEAEKKENF